MPIIAIVGIGVERFGMMGTVVIATGVDAEEKLAIVLVRGRVVGHYRNERVA